MNCPACSAPVEAAATWCPTCGAVLRVDPVPVTRPVDPARSAANKALAFSLPGLCCAPVAVRQRLAGKREAATIDERVACDLVEEQLREGLYGGWAADEVTCQGPFKSGPDQARLEGVEMKFSTNRIRLNACLVRAQRWFVLSVTTDAQCPARPRPISGSSSEAEENALRRQAAEEGDEKAVAAFLAALDRVRDVVASSDRSKRVCPPIDVASLSSSKNDTRLRVRTVELERLEGPPRPGWEFLTSNEVGTAMDVRIPIRERAAAVRRISLDGGPYLVVFQTIDEDWPVFRDIETEEHLQGVLAQASDRG